MFITAHSISVFFEHENPITAENSVLSDRKKT